ncbi:MAG TPA: GNAT family N-acetyltransferase [Clostridium sp.]|nr:hypothetical protein A7W90_09100 [Clostridium sp. Bc-iso-3]HHV30342.1 GNAT family N-acetyltransferase [Clostridium sp.]
MELKVKKVSLKSKDVKAIYFDSFPPNERMPFWMMVLMSKLWNTKFLSFYDNDKLCGFIYFAVQFKQVFVMFFAVDKELRSKGYGREILNELKKLYPMKKVIVSIEHSNTDKTEEQERRKRFYLNNGFEETGYLIRMNGVEQEILVRNGKFNKAKFRAFLAFYSNGTLWPKIWKECGVKKVQ